MPHLVAILIYLSQTYSYYIRGDRSPLTHLLIWISPFTPRFNYDTCYDEIFKGTIPVKVYLYLEAVVGVLMH